MLAALAADKMTPHVSGGASSFLGESDAGRRGLLDALWRRRRIFLAIFASILGLTGLALVILPARYRATGAVILAEQEAAEQRDSSSAFAQKLGDPADMESQLLVIGSPRMLRLALAKEGARAAALADCAGAAGRFDPMALVLSSFSNCEKLKSGDDAMVEYLRTRYTIGNVGRSRVINVSYDSKAPAVAQKLANALIEAFLEDQRASIDESRQRAARGIWDELARVNAEIRDDDAKIDAFRFEKGLERGSVASVAAERVTAMLQELSSAEAAHSEAEARLEEIVAGRDGGSLDAPAALGSRTVADLKQQLATVDVQLAAARSTLGRNHPSRMELERQHAALVGRIGVEVDALLVGARKRVESTSAVVAQLKRQLDSAKAEAGAARAGESEIESLVRAVEIKRRKYADLYSRASELETERRVLRGNAHLVHLAELPDLPFFPKRIPFLAAGFTLASLLGGAVAFWWDCSDQNVYRLSQMQRVGDVEACVELPRMVDESAAAGGAKRASEQPTVALRRALRSAKRDDAAQAALFALYSALFPADEEPYRTVAVTSPAEGDGKTFVALALARFAAEMGRRTLIVECDPARGVFTELFGLEPGPGLFSALSDAARPRGSIVKIPIARLYALPIEGPDEKRRRRVGDRIARFLTRLDAFDLVLLDCPPTSSLDAKLIVRRVEAVLLCARAGACSAQQLGDTLETLRAGGARVRGLALTQVEAKDAPSLKRFALLRG